MAQHTHYQDKGASPKVFHRDPEEAPTRAPSREADRSTAAEVAELEQRLSESGEQRQLLVIANESLSESLRDLILATGAVILAAGGDVDFNETAIRAAEAPELVDIATAATEAAKLLAEDLGLDEEEEPESDETETASPETETAAPGAEAKPKKKKRRGGRR